LVALFLIIRSVDLSTSWQILTHAAPMPLLVVFGVIAMQVGLRSWRWRLLLGSGAEGQEVPLRRIPGPLLIGYLANAILPARLGEAVRAGVLGRREHLSFGGVFGTVVLERIIDTVSLALLVSLAAALVGAPAWLTSIGLLLSGLGLLALVLLATIGLEPLLAVSAPLFRLMPASLSVPLLSAARRFIAGIRIRDRRRASLLAFGISIACWGLETASFWLTAYALGFSLDPAGALLVAGFTVLGTAIPAAPGYVGTYELAVVTVARALGVAAAPAFAYALLVHLITFGPLIVGGAVSMVALDIRVADLSTAAQAPRQTQKADA